MIELTCAAAGALAVSLWWLARMRRAARTWQTFVDDWQEMNEQADRIMHSQEKQIRRLLKELHDWGHPNFQDPEFHPPAQSWTRRRPALYRQMTIK